MNERDAAAKDVDSLREDLKQLRADLAGLARTLQTLAGEAGSDAYSKVRASAVKARNRAETAAGEIGTNIEERPFTSLGVAFVVGVMLGVLFGRRRDG